MNAYETQLLFAHCQKHLVAASKTTPAKTIRTASRALAELADIFNMPITFAFVPDDKGGASPIPELEDYLTDGNNFLRLAATPFLDEAFAQSLDAMVARTSSSRALRRKSSSSRPRSTLSQRATRSMCPSMPSAV